MEQNFNNNFKNLLAYFVSHLEWVAAKNDSSKGFRTYIEPFINNKSFKRTGQGYNGDKIQNQIVQWSHYAHGEICINVQPNFGDYKTSKCYLNWKSTGLNIIAKWEDAKVVSLYQEEYFYWEKPPTRSVISEAKTIEVLGLFDDENNASPDLINFFKDFEREIIRYNQLERDKKQMEHTNSYIKLLEYKKQIILQGPPGTGKTRLAKELAKMLIGAKLNSDKPLTITNQQIIDTLKDVKIIKTVAGNVDYKLVNVDVEKQQVILQKSTEIQEPSSFSFIKESYRTKSYLSEIQDNPSRRLSAIANYIYQNIEVEIGKFEDSEQFKLIQFHPSYTYEDFVRGISAESNGVSIEYKNVNRTLGLFAKEAFFNFLDSKKTISRLKKDLTFNEKFNSFKTLVVNSLAEGKYFNIPNTTAQIIDVDEIQFKYTFSANPSYNYSLLFSDFFKLYELGDDFKTSSDITRLESHLTRRSVGTYYFHLYKLIESQLETIEGIEVPPLKNYVLIIDEINRANLSSVLGELIYALEYRGEEVESMYAVDGSNGLILPPNLYIVGTMNTADRSVGHIDYAIRRRFSFVDVLPKKLEGAEIVFHNVLFKQVAGLFIKNYDNYVLNNAVPLENEREYLSEEFEAKDVWLGHSYFIQKKIKDTTTLEPENFNIRVKYEIVPILREYVKDGILNEKATTIINAIDTEYTLI